MLFGDIKRVVVGNTDVKVIWSVLDKKKPEQEEGGQEDVA